MHLYQLTTRSPNSVSIFCSGNWFTSKFQHIVTLEGFQTPSLFARFTALQIYLEMEKIASFAQESPHVKVSKFFCNFSQICQNLEGGISDLQEYPYPLLCLSKLWSGTSSLFEFFLRCIYKFAEVHLWQSEIIDRKAQTCLINIPQFTLYQDKNLDLKSKELSLDHNNILWCSTDQDKNVKPFLNL